MQKCAENVIVRGLVRVRCVQEMERVLNFMTRKGLINTGALAVTQPLLPEKFCTVSVIFFLFPSFTVNIFINQCEKITKKNYNISQKKVIVVGAGASGLAAARQLQNFGTQVDKLLHVCSCSSLFFFFFFGWRAHSNILWFCSFSRCWY